jgi:hypothetical protein
VAPPAPRGAGRRSWPRRQGRFGPRRWRSRWGAAPAHAPISWAAVSPTGMATHGRGSFPRRPSSRTAPPRPCGGFARPLNGYPGAISAGGSPSPHALPGLMPPSLPGSLSTRVPAARLRSSSRRRRRPRCRRDLARLRPCQPSPPTGPTAVRMQTSAWGPATGLPPVIPGQARSMGRVMTAHGSRNSIDAIKVYRVPSPNDNSARGEVAMPRSDAVTQRAGS